MTKNILAVAMMGCMMAFGAVGCGDDSSGTTNDLSVRNDMAVTGGDAGGGAKSYTNTLTAAQEMPVCANAAAGATGMSTVMIDAAGSTVTATLTWAGLSNSANAAHIHAGLPGASGPPMFDFGTVTGVSGTVTKTFTSADVKTGASSFADAISKIKSGAAYVNVHDGMAGPPVVGCPGGEIRAQIM